MASTTARGYGHHHQQQRKRWQKVIDRGEGQCARCGGPIPPGTPWHLDHDDDRSGYLGPSHAACNTAAGARKGNRGRALRRVGRMLGSGSW